MNECFFCPSKKGPFVPICIGRNRFMVCRGCALDMKDQIDQGLKALTEIEDVKNWYSSMKPREKINP